MSANRLLKITCVFAALSWLATATATEDEDQKKPDLPLEGKTVSLTFSTDEGSWLSLDVTPDGETIIFDLLGDLYSLPMSGGRATRITSGLGFDSQPVVSPDGEWLAFISDRSGSNNLRITKSDGSDARKLSDDSQWGGISPAWMPDSQYIVVTRRSVKNEFTMFHIDGGKGVKLNGVKEDEEVWGIGAEISPDGKFLYFAQGVDRNGPVKNFPATQISRYDFATGAVDQITRGEGGGDQKMDITHAIDGMHGNEHTLPDSPIFKDVVELFARTRTAYTPTLIVQHNAQSMREYFFTRTDVHNNPKLRRFYPHNRLDELTRRRPGWQLDDEFQFRQAAAQAAKIQRAGGLVGIGAHSELQGLGYHWEMWAFEMGGMTPVEVLRAATIDGARIIGIDQDLGSIEAGKLADMVILDANPLENIRNTETIYRVVQNGRLYEGDTLDQVWPDATPLAPSWWWSADDPRFNTGAISQ